MAKKVINVTKPFLPPLDEFMPLLRDIWDSASLTNNGSYNQRFCKALEKVWGVEHVVTFSNGTQALLAALSCMNNSKKGEIITTAFTFIATTNSIVWAGHKPVFVDIEPNTLNIDVVEIEKAINEQTVAILAVHCYGNPCDVEQLDALSKKYQIPIIYDAAHAFGVEHLNKSLMQFGDMSVVSFHATKVLNTFEGGAVACHSAITKKKLMNFANFGFQNETTISSLGLNAKMSEFNAALGLLQLQYTDQIIKARTEIAATYHELLQSIDGLKIIKCSTGVKVNHAYFPIIIRNSSKCDRDSLYLYLREHGFMVRKYFYPLTCDFGIAEIEQNSITHNIDIAKEHAEQILCLPIYPSLSLSDVHDVARLIKEKLS